MNRNEAERESWLAQRLLSRREGGDTGASGASAPPPADGEDRAELAALERAWDRLELPATGGVPPGFAARVAARARSESGQRNLATLSGLGRWATASALAFGIALGGLVAVVLGGTEDDATEEATLAESYLEASAGAADVDGATPSETPAVAPESPAAVPSGSSR